ncbi:sensor domain-containing phosphodiesterase [Vibrio vulnificus]|uniref:sensor domain-containing phosphodiesterase n=1 Tax=Vibrio vulnificus TaxID=672 RepID=UPI001CCF93F8|nr:EAL domain-containing protein [Vibrio vulnificus]MCA0761751.1 EAL domain-containing protein [Vibrio vulnificus]
MIKEMDFSKPPASLFDYSSEGLWVLDENNKISYYNSTFYNQFDLSINCPLLTDWFSLIHPNDKEILHESLFFDKLNRTQDRIKTRYRVKNRHGFYLWIETTSVLVEDMDELLIIGCHKIISEDVLLEQHLPSIINHNDEYWVFVYYLSDFYFQHIYKENDSHNLYSILICVLDNVFQNKCIVYRVSPDVIISLSSSRYLPNKNVTNLLIDIDNKFNYICQKNFLPIHYKLRLSAVPLSSIGHNNIQKHVYKLVDYIREFNVNIVYEGTMKNEIDRYLLIKDTLDSSIRNGEISIALQPIINYATSSIVSFEALARWQHPILGKILPSEFIRVAERFGQIHLLGLTVLDQACDFIAKYRLIYNVDTYINVNISVQQLKINNFIENVLDVVKKHGLKPDNIVLEITESYMIDEIPSISAQLSTLYDLGFKLSIDDFGAGMSSFTSLFRYPLHQIKLDRQVVCEAVRQESCRKLVSQLCDFAIGNSIIMVAEGIENNTELELLKSSGIEYFQGFYFNSPNEPDFWLNLRSLI